MINHVNDKPSNFGIPHSKQTITNPYIILSHTHIYIYTSVINYIYMYMYRHIIYIVKINTYNIYPYINAYVIYVWYVYLLKERDISTHTNNK